MSQKITSLRTIPLFAELSEAALRRVANVAIRRTYPAEAIIQLEGEPCEAAYFIVAGEVWVYRLSPDGRRQVLAHLETGQSFNTVPLFQHTRPWHTRPQRMHVDDMPVNPASAVALTEVTLYALLAADFRRLVESTPELALVILHDFADRLAHLTDLAADLSLRSVRARLARFLLDQTADAAPARWTHEEIAMQLGTVREVVSRTLRAFVREGLLEAQRQRIAVLDRAALEQEAEV